MGDNYEVVLEKEVYSPGDTVNGNIECDFSDENQIKGIRIKFRGRAKVYWKEGHTNVYCAEEVYFQNESDLLSTETTFQPGLYSYPFTFTLPNQLPSSMDEEHGNVKYSVQVTIDRPWAFNYESKQIFTVISYYDLDATEEFKKPSEFTEEKQPFSLLNETGPITINVQLPKKGYVPSQMIAFSAKIRNHSNIAVEKIHFKPVQGFTFHVKENSRRTDSFVGEEFVVEDSSVAAGTEKSWDLKIQVPSDIFNGNLNFCNIIKIFWELRGEVCLPFPYTNFTIHVPFILGSAPLIDVETSN